MSFDSNTHHIVSEEDVMLEAFYAYCVDNGGGFTKESKDRMKEEYHVIKFNSRPPNNDITPYDYRLNSITNIILLYKAGKQTAFNLFRKLVKTEEELATKEEHYSILEHDRDRKKAEITELKEKNTILEKQFMYKKEEMEQREREYKREKIEVNELREQVKYLQNAIQNEQQESKEDIKLLKLQISHLEYKIHSVSTRGLHENSQVFDNNYMQEEREEIREEDL